MMQVINRKHRGITEHKGTPCFVMINERVIHFTSAAAIRFKLKTGMYMHFLNDEDSWHFYTNDDKDGFELVPGDHKNQISVRIFSAALANMIRKSVKPKDDVLRFYIKETEKKYKDENLFEILTDKTVENVGK